MIKTTKSLVGAWNSCSMNKTGVLVFSRYILLIFISTSVFFLARSQTSVLDSLENELTHHTKENRDRVDLLTNYVHVLTDVNLKKAEETCIEAKRIAEKLNYSQGIANVYYEEAWIYIGKTDYPEAVNKAQKALKKYKELNNKRGQSLSLNCIGTSYYFQSNFSMAVEYYLKSAKIDEELNDVKGISGSYLNIGNIYADQGNFENSLSYYFKALELKKKVKDEPGMAKCLGNIGSVYGEQGNYPKALEYFKKAQAKHEKLGNSTNASICLMNIGATYLHQEKLEDAMNSFRKVLERNKKGGNKRILAMVYSEMGNVFKQKGDFDNAGSYYKNALELNRSGNNLREVASNLNNIGSILMSKQKNAEALAYFEEARQINESNDLSTGLCSSLIGIAKVRLEKNELNKALENGLSAKKIAYETNLLAHQRDVTEVLSKVYSKLGRYDQAFQYHQEFKHFSDSIFNKEKIEKIAEIEYDFKFQKELEVFNAKEQKLTNKVKSTSRDLEKSQTQLLFGIVIFLVILLITSLVIFQLRLRNIKSRNENILLEQKLLRSQMTPHFIFNSLSVLQGMILNKEAQKASLYLSKFSKLLRVTLESSREKMTPLSHEIIALENYVALQNIESDQTFGFTMTIEDDLNTSNVLIPPMLIQPFVENAIEHAFPQGYNEKEISVEFQIFDNKLVCIIKDNGIGIQEKDNQINTNKKSLATAISKERIELLAREFNSEGSIQISDRKINNEQGTQVKLIIPYKYSKA